ncbi:29671_t:CDS:1, partial [Gigaspora margarita]
EKVLPVLYMDICPSKLLDMDSSWTMSKGPVHIIINDQYCIWTNVQSNLWTWTNVHGQCPKISK